MDLRRYMKRTIEHGALWSGAPRAMRWRRRRDVLVLAYHNIVPHGEIVSGDASLHLPQSHFAAQLDALSRTHDIVPLANALDERQSRRPAVVITFDDAYRGAVTAGVAELATRGMPATIFVATAYVNDGDFWWDSLADPLLGAPSPELRRRALDECAGEDAAVRDMAARDGLSRAVMPPPHARGADERELASAALARGVTLASHTHSHPNLARLVPDRLRAELEQPLAWLRDRFVGVLPVLSYPYGISSAEVERAAEEAGYDAAFRIDGGWLPRPVRRHFALPRLNVPSGLSTAGLSLQCAGVRLR
ncbi:MAG TPA: polysaccharide deacetylase family protein [Gemmatimonadaceae bacterium]|jgi:peptidoglycan/xylan/chitin deacetylase (PgdA/CDA1 family)